MNSDRADRGPLELNGSHRKQLRDALVDAFPNWKELARRIQYGLGLDPKVITGDVKLDNAVFDLIERCRAEGRLEALITFAIDAAPGDERLRELAAELGILPIGGIEQFLREKAEQNLLPPRPPPLVDWAGFRQACQVCSRRALEKMKGQDLDVSFVARAAIEGHIQQFIASDATFLVIVGDSGMGKTLLLRHLIQQWTAQPEMAVMAYDAPMLDSSPERIEEQVEKDLRLRLDFTGRALLRTIGKESLAPGRKLLVLVDAINESCDVAGLVQRIDRLPVDVFPWIKVIMTCRPQAWKQARGKGVRSQRYYQVPGRNQIGVDLGRFTPQEAAEAYKVYQQIYRFQGPPFEKLSPILRSRLEDPLLLWMIAEISRDEPLPDEIPALDIDMVPQYVEQLIAVGRLDRSDLSFLVAQVNPRLIDASDCAGTVGRDHLDNISRIAATCLDNLLNAGILIETSSDTDGGIRYRYERFQDYYLGELLYNHYAARPRG
jgi:hypothetical protein